MDSDHSHDHDHNGEATSSLLKRLQKIVTLGHSHDHEHSHDFFLTESTDEGIRAVKLSFLALMITAVLQVIVVYFTDSIALLADTVHNFSDAFTSIPLWLAFQLSRRSKNQRYSYGYGRAEDLAGLFIVLMIAASSVLIFVESIRRIVNPIEIRNLGALAAAAIIGFVGNELVAQYRIRKGKEIGSEALVADGLHSRTDGLTSLSILVGVFGALIGLPILDPIVGIVIGFLILIILRDAAKTVFGRLMDAIDPEIIETITNTACSVDGVHQVHDVRARWSGRQIFTEFHIEVSDNLTLQQSHELIEEIERQLRKAIPNISSASIHVDPMTQ